jgi:rhodanese-related sulfurtransferase
MRGGLWYLVAGAIGASPMAGCGQAKPAASSGAEQSSAAAYTDITVRQLHDMMAAKDFVLVNVHEPYAGDIAGTDLSIAFDRIGEHLDRLPADRAAKVVLYCRSGRMSATAAATLAALRYTNVFNVVGGMQEWSAAGYPLEQRGQPQS